MPIVVHFYVKDKHFFIVIVHILISVSKLLSRAFCYNGEVIVIINLLHQGSFRFFIYDGVWAFILIAEFLRRFLLSYCRVLYKGCFISFSVALGFGTYLTTNAFTLPSILKVLSMN